MKTETKSAQVIAISGSYRRGIALLRLDDGTCIRAITGQLLLPHEAHLRGVTIMYDVDAAGNRFNPRRQVC